MANNFQNKGSVVTAETIHGNVTLNTSFNQHSNPQQEKIRMNVFNPHHDFVGRSNELNLLKKETTNDGPAQNPHITIVCGLGGVGKTQLVRKFIAENQSMFEHIIWIESQERASLEDNIKQLAKELRLTTDLDDFKRVVEKVFNALSTSQSLIVFDNVDHREHIRFVFNFATFGQKLSIVVTSRLQQWSDSAFIIQLGVFNFDDANKFVSETLKFDDIDTETLIDKLQYFPLALRQATSYIKYEREERNPNFMIADYLKVYNTQELLNYDVSETDLSYTYDHTTFTTWGVTIQALERSGPTGKLALRILSVITFFNPDHICRDIFFDLTEQETDENVRQAIKLLVDYSMVNRIDSPEYIIQIHRLVQEVLKINSNNNGQTEGILRDGLRLISKVMGKKTLHLHENHEHAILVFTFALKFHNLVKDFKTIPSRIIGSLSDWGKTITASEFGEKILQPFTDIIGVDDSDTILTKYNLARAYNDRGRHSDALQMFLEVHSVEKRTLGEDNLGTLKTMKNIAFSYQDLGKHSEANQIFQDVYLRHRNRFGESHAETLKSKQNIAFSNRTLGKYAEALEMLQENYVERKIFFGENHPETILTARHIGALCLDLGKHSEALKIYLNVLENEKKILMENVQYYPKTLKTTFYIAQAYCGLGKYSEALEMFEDVLVKQKNFFGENYPEIALTLENIALVYLHSGKPSKALQMFQDVVDMQKNIFGEDHQMPLINRCNVAITYGELGKHFEALQIFKDVLVKQKNIFGDKHPQIFKTQFCIALTSFKLDKRPQTLKMLEEVLNEAKKLIGEEYSEILKAKFHIAVSYRDLGKHSEAIEMFQNVFDKQKHIFGDDHPETLKTEFNIASTYRKVGKHSEALEMLQNVFHKQKKIFGVNHPKTLQTKTIITSMQLKKYFKAQD